MRAFVLSVDRLPVAGESLAATRYFQEHGGKGLNLGVGLHRLGVAVDLLMAVGQDDAGAAVTRRLAEEGIGTDWVLTLGPNSGYGVGFIAPDGRNFLAAHPGANALLTPEHVERHPVGVGVPPERALHVFDHLPGDAVGLALHQQARSGFGEFEHRGLRRGTQNRFDGLLAARQGDAAVLVEILVGRPPHIPVGQRGSGG